jgi:hypothetical protein
LVALLLVGGIAHAQDQETERVRALFKEGTKLYNLGRFGQALDKFQEAYLVRPDPVFLFNLGQCHRMMGHLKEEVYSYRRYLVETPNAPNRSEVQRFIEEAEKVGREEDAAMRAAATHREEPRSQGPPIGTVEIVSTPPGATVRLEDPGSAPVGKTPYRNGTLMAGAHLAFLSLDGYASVQKAFSVGQGETLRLDLTLVPPASAVVTAPGTQPNVLVAQPPPKPGMSTRTKVIIGVVVGVVAVALVATVVGIVVSRNSATILPTVGN